MTNPPTKNQPSSSFESLANEFAQKLRRGESPSINEFAERNDELASRVLRLFPVLELLEQNGPSEVISEADLLRAEQEILGPATEIETIAQWTAPKRLGDFRLIREIGRGGMGIVYEAEQESLGRRVAIKILAASAQFDERRMERFATEAKASAMLHHTNIVPVFGVGRENGLSFFVMQFINGQPLDRVLKDVSRVRALSAKNLDDIESDFSHREIARSMFGEPTESVTQLALERNDEAVPNRACHNNLSAQEDLPQVSQAQKNQGKGKSEKRPNLDSAPATDSTPACSPISQTQILTGSNSESASLNSSDSFGNPVRNYFRNVARIGVKVSEALNHAHSHGILHRDIKPSNLMLGDKGAVWVTDFGLAKYFESPDITRTGEVVGTLRYMSPEQLSGEASCSSDIFGLGLTLYEMLARQPAYSGADKKQLLEKVTEANPTALRSIDSRIPRDLETIVMKCIHSEPSKRYSAVSEVGEDLTRFIEGQPILARRISVAEKAWKWCCRRPTLAATIAALAASILLGAIGVGWQWSKTSDALAVSQTNFEKAKQATLRAEENSSKAKEHFDQARSAVVQITESISSEELLTRPDLLPLRRKLLLKALDFQIEFVKNHPENVEVELELADAWLNLAAVSSELPKTEEARQCLKSSRAILDSLLDKELTALERERAIICLAETHSIEGEIATRTTPDGLVHLFDAVRILLDGRDENELSNVELFKLADLHRNIGDGYTEQNVGRPHPLKSLTQNAFTHYTKSFEIAKRVVKTDGSDTQIASMLANVHRNLGMANRRLKNKQQAFEHYTSSVDQFRELVEVEPENTNLRYGLAEALGSLAFYYAYSQNDTETALEYYHESIAEYRRLSDAYPSVLKFVFAETKAAMNCSILYERRLRSKEAIELRERSGHLGQMALLVAPNDPKLLSSYGKALMGMGMNCTKRSKLEQAQGHLEQARLQHEKAVSIAPLNPTYRIRLCRSIINIGYNLRAKGEFENARRMMLEAVHNYGPDSGTPDTDVTYMTSRALLQLARRIQYFTPEANESDLEVADRAIESAKEILGRFVGPDKIISDRFLADRKFKAFAKSEQGVSFLAWLENVETQTTEDETHTNLR